jgi:H+/Cl- antiporter ClcA
MNIWWVLLGAACGSIAGSFWLLLNYLSGLSAGIDGFYLIGFMASAGLLIGLIIYFLGDPGELAFVIHNIHFNKGRLPLKHNPSMFFASLFSISAGGSVGPEAPMVQLTGSLGSWFGDKLKLTGENMRTMTIAGMAAGLTALFASPIGGTLFALEILHHKYVMEYYEAVIPAFVSSCASYIIFSLITHSDFSPIWTLPVVQHIDALSFFHAMVFGLAGALAGWLFIKIFSNTKYVFEKLSVPVYIKSTIAGALLGLIAFYCPLTRFFGHDQLNYILTHEISLKDLSILFFLKIIAIAVTLSGSWKGGFIIPLFFLGACAGKLLFLLFPGIDESLAIVCCMAAINSCVTKTPLSTTILLATLTGFHPFIPILFASLTGYFLSPKIPLIETQLKEMSLGAEAADSSFPIESEENKVALNSNNPATENNKII